MYMGYVSPYEYVRYKCWTQLVNVVCWAVYLLLWVLSTWQESYHIRQMTLLFQWFAESCRDYGCG